MCFNHFFLAWIHWDPPRVAFTLPIIERPVAWYGIFFALGFILGFFIIIPLFKRKLLQENYLLERDIANWPLLITELRKGVGQKDSCYGSLVEKLSDKSLEAIKNFKFKQEPDENLKAELLHLLNSAFTDRQLKFNRAKIERLFPKAVYTARELSLFLADKMTWFVVGGTVIGARLGHVFFYDWPRYQTDLLGILKIWEGGLASHGGTIGIIASLFAFLKYIRPKFPEFHLADLLDILCIPTALAACCIRVGNFFNQEILGRATAVPWAIVFEHPYDGGAPHPRHPSQLYEAAVYFMTFCLLYFIWKTKPRLKSGLLVGLFMVIVFGSRFIIEFSKAPQSMVFDESLFNVGQILSIPFILLGLYFLFTPSKAPKLKFN